MIVEEQGIDFRTGVRFPSAPLWIMSVFPYFIRDSGIFFLEMLDYLSRLFSLELQPDLSAVFWYYYSYYCRNPTTSGISSSENTCSSLLIIFLENMFLDNSRHFKKLTISI